MCPRPAPCVGRLCLPVTDRAEPGSSARPARERNSYGEADTSEKPRPTRFSHSGRAKCRTTSFLSFRRVPVLPTICAPSRFATCLTLAYAALPSNPAGTNGAAYSALHITPLGGSAYAVPPEYFSGSTAASRVRLFRRARHVPAQHARYLLQFRVFVFDTCWRFQSLSIQLRCVRRFGTPGRRPRWFLQKVRNFR